jgi:hypothetical protein
MADILNFNFNIPKIRRKDTKGNSTENKGVIFYYYTFSVSD